MSAKSEMQRKHQEQMYFHERNYGVPLGVLKNPPSQKRLDDDYKKRKAEKTLFSQMPKVRVAGSA